ncbi:MAG: hypothetical protein Kapaf2KO_16140 [Candidatus Kapaibacteriales bacterium]
MEIKDIIYRVSVRDEGVLSLLKEMQRQKMLTLTQDKELPRQSFYGILNFSDDKVEEYIKHVAEVRAEWDERISD